jgi:hypothetical protein
MIPNRTFVGIANDKGGVGKSLTSALIVEELAGADQTPWHLVEIEQRANFTQQNYEHPKGTLVRPIALLAQNEKANRTEPSLAPLDEMWELIPPDGDAVTPSRIVVDFGAAAFQSFLLWGLQRRGIQPFRSAGFHFVFFIPVQAGDSECAEFFNQNASTLMKLGKVVLVKNLREGSDFSLLNGELVTQVPSLTLLYEGPPLTLELQQANRRVTFRQVAALPTASRRARMDAESCADHFTKQFQPLRIGLGL